MKTVKINVDLDTKQVDFGTERILSLTQQLRLLKKELQTVPQDSEQFQILSARFRDTEDAIKQVNVRSRDFFSALGTLPGIVGFAGRSMDGLIDTFKIFGSLKLTDLQVQLKDSVGDLKEMGATLLRVTGITSVYTATLNRLTTAEGAASTGAKVLAASVATVTAALGAGLIYLLVEAGKAIYNMIDPTEKEAEALLRLKDASNDVQEALDYSLELNTESTKVRIANAKAVGASEEELIKIQQESNEEAKRIFTSKIKEYEADIKNYQKVIDTKTAGNKKITEDDKKNLADAQKNLANANTTLGRLNTQTYEIQSQLDQKRLKDREEINKRIKAQTDKDLVEITKNAAAARLTLLAERDKEIALITTKYTEQINLAKKYGKDITVLEAARDKELTDLRAKFTKEDLEAVKKLNEEKLAFELSVLELRKSTGEIKEDEYQLALRNIRIKYAGDEKAINEANSEFNTFKRQADFDKEVADLTLQYQKKLAFVQDDQVAKLFLEDEFQRELNNIKIKYADDENVITDITAEQYQKLAEQQAALLETTENINKQIAQSWVDLTSSIASSFRELANVFEAGSDAAKIFGVISVIINAASAIGRINIGLAESVSSLNTAIAQGTASIASGGALLSNPVTAILGAAQIAAGKAAITTATLGIAKAKTTATAQKIGVGITSAAQIAAILGAKKQGSATGAAGGGSAGQAISPTFTQPSIGAPQIGATSSQEGTIAGIVSGALQANQSGGRPIRAYVVGNDITTEQQLSRRIRTAARLGG